MATMTIDEPQTSTLDRPVWSALSLDWEKALYIGLIIAALVTRFYDLGARVMSHDESLHTQFAWYLFQGRGFNHDPVMHGPLKFELTAFMYWLFGDNDFTARIPSALMGVAAVGLMWYFRKWLGRTGALAAAFFMLISPYQLYYARYIRDEPYVMVWGLLTALCVLNYMETRATKYLYGLTVVMALFYATMETSFIYNAIFMVFLGLHVMVELLRAEWPDHQHRTWFLSVLGLAVLAALIGAGIFLYKDRGGLSGTEFTPSTTNPDDPASVSSPLTGVMNLSFLLAVLTGLAALVFVFRAFGEKARQFPALDLIILFGVFVLPQLAGFPVKMLGRNPISYNVPPLTDLSGLMASDAFVTFIVVLILLIASLAIGWAWNLRVFLICAAIFYGLYIPLYTTFFTNGGGLATGLVGSLGYWLEQHSVRRGSQPWYYYLLINLPVYEYLALIGTLFAAGLGIKIALDRSRAATANLEGADGMEAAVEPKPSGFPAILLIGFWSLMALPIFSIAGEKMPWLTDHIVLPMILLSGWAVGWFIDRIDWGHFRQQRAWIVAIVLPITGVALAGAFGSLLGNKPPFQGNTLDQLQATSAFVSALIVAGIGLISLYRLGQPLGWGNVARLAVLSVFGLLSLLTIRTAFVASYINYDYANEYLVYAHGARGVKTVMEQVDDISERTTDGLGLKVAYDADVSWPMTWYLRNYKNQAFYGDQPTREAIVDTPVVIAGNKNWTKVESLVGDRYYRYEYIRMVWPMQDYFPNDKTIGERVFTNLADPQMRQAFWNIWWNRDYALYGQLTGVNYDLSQWPVVDRMRLYVKKDVAAQIWRYGVGPAAAALEPKEDPYVKGKQTIAASVIWGGVQGPAEGQFDTPRGVAIAPDGSVYVADSRNNRIQKFDANGQLIKAWGTLGKVDDNTASPGTFNEPWGIAVGPDGSVYVADTWNHRIQKFDKDGNFITMWGHFGQADTFDGLWGPRGVVVDQGGRIFVTDTGNKRIAVFDANGAGLTSIGQGGFEPGFLDEPVGLALDKDGNLYVADTWNQRVQVFRREGGTEDYLFDREWRVEAWPGQSLDNKPFIAVDEAGRVYVPEPEGYRVIVFDRIGQFVTTWGEFGAEDTSFSVLSGIAVGPQGDVYVVDAGNQRVMKFPPLAGR